MFLSLLPPLVMGIVTRLALRPRGQGQNQPLTLDIPLWGLIGGWVLSVFVALVAIPTNNFSFAISAIAMAGVAGVMVIEVLRGLGQAVATGLSKPKNWLLLIVVMVVIYGFFIDPRVIQGLMILGLVGFFLALILGIFKSSKGGKK